MTVSAVLAVTAADACEHWAVSFVDQSDSGHGLASREPTDGLNDTA